VSAYPRLLGCAALAGLVAACSDDGQGPNTGLGEPLVVTNAQFIAGPLPGTTPLDGGTTTTTAPDGGTVVAPLSVQALGFTNDFVSPQQGAKPFSGSVSKDAVAVGFRLDELGSGYWVIPVGPIDVINPAVATFGGQANFAAGVSPGLHQFWGVGIGANGQGGVQFPAGLCVESPIPDNGFACNPKNKPPGAVFTLTWDSNFDLDLHVITPDGHDLNPKSQFGQAIDAGTGPLPRTSLPNVDRDSLGSCVPDGRRQEDAVFPDGLTSGTYFVYVDPFAPCGQQSTRFTLTISETTGTCPACSFATVFTRSGEILASQVTGGASTGLFVDQLDVH
jgi:hypothetical protein